MEGGGRTRLFFFSKSNRRLIPPPIDDVIRYYEERAPVELSPIKLEKAGGPPPVSFDVRTVASRADLSSPAISFIDFVALEPKGKKTLLACEMRHGHVLTFDPTDPKAAWKSLGKLDNPAAAAVVDLDGDGKLDIVVADLGTFGPADHTKGRVVWLRNTGESYEPIVILQGVGRVASVQPADFNGDGKIDLAVAIFGWQDTGELLVLEQRSRKDGSAEFRRHELDPRHGGIHVPVADLNGDGKPDIVAVLAQEHEEVVAFLNQGDFKFEAKTIYRAPHPAYGSSGIQIVDIDRDGKLDVLYTNGDVLDQPHLLKPYHSVQWLRNTGSFPFEHRHITSLYGVHRAVAGDIDDDGDIDIVAASYLPEEHFPQRKNLNVDALILLEQTKPGVFARHTLETTRCDHVVCIMADLFGRGRLDIVVPNFTLSRDVPAMSIWRQKR